MEVLNRKLDISARIKKPNDVMVNQKKIAGILTESSAYHDRLEYVVVGIGLNVTSKRGQIPPNATSLFLETGKTEDRNVLLEQVLTVFGARYDALNHVGKATRGQAKPALSLLEG